MKNKLDITGLVSVREPNKDTARTERLVEQLEWETKQYQQATSDYEKDYIKSSMYQILKQLGRIK